MATAHHMFAPEPDLAAVAELLQRVAPSRKQEIVLGATRLLQDIQREDAEARLHDERRFAGDGAPLAAFARDGTRSVSSGGSDGDASGSESGASCDTDDLIDQLLEPAKDDGAAEADDDDASDAHDGAVVVISGVADVCSPAAHDAADEPARAEGLARARPHASDHGTAARGSLLLSRWLRATRDIDGSWIAGFVRDERDRETLQHAFCSALEAAAVDDDAVLRSLNDDDDDSNERNDGGNRVEPPAAAHAQRRRSHFAGVDVRARDHGVMGEGSAGPERRGLAGTLNVVAAMRQLDEALSATQPFLVIDAYNAACSHCGLSARQHFEGTAWQCMRKQPLSFRGPAAPDGATRVPPPPNVPRDVYAAFDRAMYDNVASVARLSGDALLREYDAACGTTLAATSAEQTSARAGMTSRALAELARSRLWRGQARVLSLAPPRLFASPRSDDEDPQGEDAIATRLLRRGILEARLDALLAQPQWLALRKSADDAIDAARNMLASSTATSQLIAHTRHEIEELRARYSALLRQLSQLPPAHRDAIMRLARAQVGASTAQQDAVRAHHRLELSHERLRQRVQHAEFLAGRADEWGTLRARLHRLATLLLEEVHRATSADHAAALHELVASLPPPRVAAAAAPAMPVTSPAATALQPAPTVAAASSPRAALGGGAPLAHGAIGSSARVAPGVSSAQSGSVGSAGSSGTFQPPSPSPSGMFPAPSSSSGGGPAPAPAEDDPLLPLPAAAFGQLCSACGMLDGSWPFCPSTGLAHAARPFSAEHVAALAQQRALFDPAAGREWLAAHSSHDLGAVAVHGIGGDAVAPGAMALRVLRGDARRRVAGLLARQRAPPRHLADLLPQHFPAPQLAEQRARSLHHGIATFVGALSDDEELATARLCELLANAPMSRRAKAGDGALHRVARGAAHASGAAERKRRSRQRPSRRTAGDGKSDASDATSRARKHGAGDRSRDGGDGSNTNSNSNDGRGRDDEAESGASSSGSDAEDADEGGAGGAARARSRLGSVSFIRQLLRRFVDVDGDRANAGERVPDTGAVRLDLQAVHRAVRERREQLVRKFEEEETQRKAELQTLQDKIARFRAEKQRFHPGKYGGWFPNYLRSQMKTFSVSERIKLIRDRALLDRSVLDLIDAMRSLTVRFKMSPTEFFESNTFDNTTTLQRLEGMERDLSRQVVNLRHTLKLAHVPARDLLSWCGEMEGEIGKLHDKLRVAADRCSRAMSELLSLDGGAQAAASVATASVVKKIRTGAGGSGSGAGGNGATAAGGDASALNATFGGSSVGNLANLFASLTGAAMFRGAATGSANSAVAGADAASGNASPRAPAVFVPGASSQDSELARQRLIRRSLSFPRASAVGVGGSGAAAAAAAVAPAPATESVGDKRAESPMATSAAASATGARGTSGSSTGTSSGRARHAAVADDDSTPSDSVAGGGANDDAPYPIDNLPIVDLGAAPSDAPRAPPAANLLRPGNGWDVPAFSFARVAASERDTAAGDEGPSLAPPPGLAREFTDAFVDAGPPPLMPRAVTAMGETSSPAVGDSALRLVPSGGDGGGDLPFDPAAAAAAAAAADAAAAQAARTNRRALPVSAVVEPRADPAALDSVAEQRPHEAPLRARPAHRSPPHSPADPLPSRSRPLGRAVPSHEFAFPAVGDTPRAGRSSPSQRRNASPTRAPLSPATVSLLPEGAGGRARADLRVGFASGAPQDVVRAQGGATPPVGFRLATLERRNSPKRAAAASDATAAEALRPASPAQRGAALARSGLAVVGEAQLRPDAAGATRSGGARPAAAAAAAAAGGASAATDGAPVTRHDTWAEAAGAAAAALALAPVPELVPKLPALRGVAFSEQLAVSEANRRLAVLVASSAVSGTAAGPRNAAAFPPTAAHDAGAAPRFPSPRRVMPLEVAGDPPAPRLPAPSPGLPPARRSMAVVNVFESAALSLASSVPAVARSPVLPAAAARPGGAVERGAATARPALSSLGELPARPSPLRWAHGMQARADREASALGASLSARPAQRGPLAPLARDVISRTESPRRDDRTAAVAQQTPPLPPDRAPTSSWSLPPPLPPPLRARAGDGPRVSPLAAFHNNRDEWLAVQRALTAAVSRPPPAPPQQVQPPSAAPAASPAGAAQSTMSVAPAAPAAPAVAASDFARSMHRRVMPTYAALIAFADSAGGALEKPLAEAGVYEPCSYDSARHARSDMALIGSTPSPLRRPGRLGTVHGGNQAALLLAPADLAPLRTPAGIRSGLAAARTLRGLGGGGGAGHSRRA
jgi:hypothetical protein